LQESEARVRAFEREQKGLSGLSEEDMLKATFEDQVDTLNQGVVEETPNTVTYPRDFVGTKFRKEKVKYKVDVYVPFRSMNMVLMIDILRRTMWDF
jgi:hypothetical protein